MMMRSPAFPRVLKILGAVSLLCLAVAGLMSQVAAALAEATERDVTYRYFDEALSPGHDMASVVAWSPAPAPLDRVFGPAERRVVGGALTRAWAAHAVALETGSPAGLSDHFAGVALERAERSADGSGSRMVVLTQEARPVFFHADGSLLQVETTSIVARFRAGPDDGLAAFSVTRDTNLTTLRNDAAGWRILSHERRGTEALAAPRAVAAPENAAGINYYPAATPWSLFWREFDAATVARDFALVNELGADSVRVFLQRPDFLDPDRATVSLTHLETLLDLAGEAGLSVVPTLFDMRGGYGTVTWANDAVYLARVMPVLAASDHVAYVDLKNEPDLDMARETPALVEAWARSMLATARSIAPGLAYTIGWAAPDAAPVMADTLDLISYHDYGPVEDSAAALAAVRAIAGNRPVHVTEIGETSFSLAGGVFPASPEAQARRLAARLEALAEADGLFVWTLHDFPDPDPVAVGRSPWVLGLQGHFGLYSPTGAPKPAAAAVTDHFQDFHQQERGFTP